MLVFWGRRGEEEVWEGGRDGCVRREGVAGNERRMLYEEEGRVGGRVVVCGVRERRRGLVMC